MNSRTANGATILVVDDEPQVVMMAVIALQRAGFVTLSATSAEEAQRLCDEHAGAIDLVVMDVLLPDTHGFDIYESLCVRRAPMKVLYMSGYPGQLLFESRGEEAPFLNKPFNGDDLVEKVEDALGFHRPMRRPRAA